MHNMNYSARLSSLKVLLFVSSVKIINQIDSVCLYFTLNSRGGFSLTWALQVCKAPKGRVFIRFIFGQIGYQFWPFLS